VVDFTEFWRSVIWEFCVCWG